MADRTAAATRGLLLASSAENGGKMAGRAGGAEGPEERRRIDPLAEKGDVRVGEPTVGGGPPPLPLPRVSNVAGAASCAS